MSITENDEVVAVIDHDVSRNVMHYYRLRAGQKLYQKTILERRLNASTSNQIVHRYFASKDEFNKDSDG